MLLLGASILLFDGSSVPAFADALVPRCIYYLSLRVLDNARRGAMVDVSTVCASGGLFSWCLLCILTDYCRVLGKLM